MSKLTQQDIEEYRELIREGYSQRAACQELGLARSTVQDYLKREEDNSLEVDIDGPKILTIDVELSPTKGAFWALFKQNIGLDQIEKDWYIISYAAKWAHESRVMYKDKRNSWQDEDDSELVSDIWKLLDEADIVVGQNSTRFDIKKINTRMLYWTMQPYSSFKQRDTLEIAKRKFAFTSNKLEYMTDRYCVRYKKLTHQKYPGYKLWAACLSGDMDAWDEMELYNINDTLSTEELYTLFRAWDNQHPNTALYYEDYKLRCKCGSTDFEDAGFAYTNVSKFRKYRCTCCGAEVRDRVNLVPKELRQNIKANVT